MTSAQSLRYHSDSPLRSAAVISVAMAGGQSAHLVRTESANGRPAWRWSGGDVAELMIEEERAGRSFLLTRRDGAPYGRIRRRGHWRPCLEAFDARHQRWGLRSGTLQDADDTTVGELTASGADQIHLTAPEVAEDTERALLRALPLCAALTGTAPLAGRTGPLALTAR